MVSLLNRPFVKCEKSFLLLPNGAESLLLVISTYIVQLQILRDRIELDRSQFRKGDYILDKNVV